MVPSEEPTLDALLRRSELGLRLISSPSSLGADTLERPLRWVHSSDLVDPTPFLADDLALLTTGTQFADEAPAGIDDYVDRLVSRGVVGLGFGTEVHRSGIPEPLVAACARSGLALFEVPYDTPFIAVARAHAEAIAAQAFARRSWALDTQRSLALAALRPNGLASALTELSRRLGHWVGLFDASGAVSHQHPADQDALCAAVATPAAELLQRARPASRTVADAAGEVTLFTLGRARHLRGVIAVAAAIPDAETRAVITSVIAMAGLSLEQGESLARERRRLHSQLLASLRTDDPTLARRVLGTLPAPPVVVAVAPGTAAGALAGWGEHQRLERGVAAFLAESDEGVTVCLPAAEEHLFDELARRFDLALGISEPADYEAFSRAHAQAVAALRGQPAPGAVRYADTAAASILTALTTADAQLVAQSRLAPLREHDAATGSNLEGMLRTWLAHDARIEPAASALAVHRHTLRTRIAQAATLLGVDLSRFPARAELWAILHSASA